MRLTTPGAVAILASLAAAKDNNNMTFAVLHFKGKGFLTEGPMDPVVNPGATATHYHSIMGGSNFGISIKGDDLLSSDCTTTTIKNDKSNYWVPTLFFQDPKDSTFEKVDLYYMNVYYFFEPTDDNLEPFPPGLKMLSGDSKTRSPPVNGARNLDPGNGPIQPIQWTCPRTSYNPPSYPTDSDGTMAGMQDPNDQGAGAGFPLYPCDGLYSPLRQDIHFPSCYNPEAGLDNYENNMAWPKTAKNGKLNCPDGYTHLPHIFYEVYWDTPSFDDRWTPDGKTQPFVLSNGDATGYSSHGDFVSGWDNETLAAIINTCNQGTVGMETCPDIPGGVNDDENCRISPAIGKLYSVQEVLTSLPLNCEVTGWGHGSGNATEETGSNTPESSSSSSEAVISTSPTGTAEAEPYSTSSAESAESAETTAAVNVNAVAAEPSNEAVSSPTTTAEPVVTAAAAVDPHISTVWDILTVTSTVTVEPESTPAARIKRRVPHHSHGHLARHAHAHGAFAGRR
ncbi:hypothetical protein F4779DRAFT_43493 [Xylariaceae sp. FL0662B]|nr:hypothetical protein F4779DRAFT_43493 [Xylariaceae sp. FL0662B]